MSEYNLCENGCIHYRVCAHRVPAGMSKKACGDYQAASDYTGHGRWIRLGDEYYKCSACNTDCTVIELCGNPIDKYCRCCGAKMDKEAQESAAVEPLTVFQYYAASPERMAELFSADHDNDYGYCHDCDVDDGCPRAKKTSSGSSPRRSTASAGISGASARS